MMSSKAQVTMMSTGNIDDLKRVFSLFDDDKTGFISIASLRRIVRDTGEAIE